MRAYRIERDSLGEAQVPADALYGAQTQRAVDNFPLSGIHLPAPFIRALGLIRRRSSRRQRASPAVWSGWRSWRLVVRPWGQARTPIPSSGGVWRRSSRP
jgi:hypothetical protein